jgi:DNA-binding beta-propeller fold protein YncE
MAVVIRTAMVLAIALGLTACGGGSSSRPTTRPPAAEPATAPSPDHRPAGTEVRVGLLPEGIVVIPRSGLVAVAVRDPAQIVLIPTGGARPLRRVSIPASPRHLELSGTGGPVLIPAETADELLELSVPRASISSIAVGVHPHDAAAAAGRVFVGNEFGRSVSVLAGSRVVGQARGFLQPGGLAAVGGAVAVVDVRADTVTLIDAHTLRALDAAPAGEGPTHVVAGGRRLFVADTRGNALLAFATEPKLHLAGRLPLPARPYGVAIDQVRNRLWVTLTATNEVAEVSIERPRLRRVASYPTGRQPNTVAVDPRDGRVYVADAGAGVVQLIDPRH